MTSIYAVLATGVTTFVATNIDDLVLLTLFFARRVKPRRVVAGQYLGFSAIILVSLLGLGLLSLFHIGGLDCSEFCRSHWESRS